MIDTSFDLFYNSNKGFWIFSIIALDFIVISLVYLFSGLLISSLINESVTKLDREKGKYIIFLEITFELIITLIFYILVYYALSKLPPLVPNIEVKNFNQRGMFKDILLLFSILSTQLRLLSKLRFLFNDNFDEEAIVDEQIRENFNNCPNGFTCAP